jgi:hypothetical protein
MLNICGSNFVPILITILACAGLFMYFNLRLAEIKVAVEKQNRVLTAFITNVQHDIRTGGGSMMPFPAGGVVGMNHLATPDAIIAAQKFKNDKIVVSDDEDDDDDDDSDSESDTDSESDDEPAADDDDLVKGEDKFEHVATTLSIVDLQDSDFENPIPITFEVLSSSITINHDIMGNSGSEGTLGSSITEIIDISATSLADAATASSYENMKVDELRKIVSDKNLASKDDIKKLKKPELLVLLKK